MKHYSSVLVNKIQCVPPSVTDYFCVERVLNMENFIAHSLTFSCYLMSKNREEREKQYIHLAQFFRTSSLLLL